MANSTLVISSIFSGVILWIFMDDLPQHSLTITIHGHLLYHLFFLGVISSILNHGLTSNIAKWVDRIIMLITGSILFLFENMQIGVFTISVIYFASKYCDDPIQTLLHCLVHVLATGLLIWFSYSYHSIGRPSGDGE